MVVRSSLSFHDTLHYPSLFVSSELQNSFTGRDIPKNAWSFIKGQITKYCCLNVDCMLHTIKLPNVLKLYNSQVGSINMSPANIKLSGWTTITEKIMLRVKKLPVNTAFQKAARLYPIHLKRLVRHFQDATSCVIFGDEPHSHEDKD